jgi:hypothetical protein
MGRPVGATPPAPGAGSGAAEREGKEDDGYPAALLQRVPRDFLPVLPRTHYMALVRAAAAGRSAAAAESLRQALVLHAEPMIPPTTSIELVLSADEEAELSRTPPEPEQRSRLEGFARGARR